MAEIVKRKTSRGEARYDVRVWIDGRGIMKTFQRRKEAEAWAADAETRRYSGLLVDPAGGRITVSQLAELWLASNPGKRESTVARDRAAIDRHILEAIGGRRIGSVRQPDIQQLVNRWSELMAPKTVGRTYGTLRAMFAYAVSTDLLARSPCRRINLPTGARRPPRALTQDQVAAIASHMDERFRLMVWLAAMLGLRWGEVAGMRMGSVDLPGRMVTIDGAVVRDRHGRSVLGPPKTQAGIRTLSLPEALAKELGAHLEALGPAGGHPEALLFSPAGRSPMSYSNFRQRIWIPAVESAGLSGTNFHDLRRTNASIMVAAGVDVKTAQHRLGHTDVRLTLELYAQVSSAADRSAAEVLGASFSGVFGHDTRDGTAITPNGRSARRGRRAVTCQKGVGLGGFEPPTSASRTQRANQTALQPDAGRADRRASLPEVPVAFGGR